ncbi:MAG TPA: DUF4136 domain-containing protein [Flavisolibacter sp.]|nr:DUF4136 domain-containing protein [Flavisolibacter sp.]
MKEKLILCVSVLSLFTASCKKDPLNNLTEDESRIYITNYDTSANFETYKTFSIADSVAVISNNQLVAHERSSADAQFIAAFINALEGRGYTRVNRDQDPDLGLALSRVTNTTTSLVSYNDYGGYYGGYWDPYYWDYPGYGYSFPTYYGVYESSETAFMADIFDLKNAEQNNQIRAVWSGMIRGSGIFNTTSIESQVAALFTQSPYLKAQ